MNVQIDEVAQAKMLADNEARQLKQLPTPTTAYKFDDDADGKKLEAYLKLLAERKAAKSKLTAE